MLCGFCIKFRSLSSSERILKIHQVLAQLVKPCAFSFGTQCIYTFWGLLPPNGILPGTKLSLRPSLYWQRYCTTFKQWASAELCGVGQ